MIDFIFRLNLSDLTHRKELSSTEEAIENGNVKKYRINRKQWSKTGVHSKKMTTTEEVC